MSNDQMSPDDISKTILNQSEAKTTPVQHKEEPMLIVGKAQQNGFPLVKVPTKPEGEPDVKISNIIGEFGVRFKLHIAHSLRTS